MNINFPRSIRRNLWILWILATSVGLVASLYGTYLFASLIAPVLGMLNPAEMKAAVGNALGGSIPHAFRHTITGTGLGIFQWLVLKQRLPKSGWWILASALGWTLGGFIHHGELMILQGVEVGIVTGAIVGLLQWLVLRERITNAGWWIPASIIGLGIGIAAGFPLEREVDLLQGAIVSGVITGIITGFALAQLFQEPLPKQMSIESG